MPKLQISSQNRPWLLFKVLLHQPVKNWSFTNLLRKMVLLFSAVWFCWMITKLRREWPMLSFHSGLSCLSHIIVRINLTPHVWNTCWKMMRNLVSLLLMVMVLSSPPCKEMLDTFNRKCRLSYPKSMVEVVSQQTDLQESEKKREVIMLPRLLRWLLQTSFKMTDQQSRVL